MEMTHVILLVVFAFWCVAGTLYGFRVKAILRDRGFPVSFLSNNFQDLSYFSELIRDESDLSKRVDYMRLRTRIRVIFAMAYLSAGALAAQMILWRHTGAPN